MRGLEKVDMKRGQTDRYIDKLTSRLLERIGLRADSLKIGTFGTKQIFEVLWTTNPEILIGKLIPIE